MQTPSSTDAQLIDALGGPAKVADLLGYDKAGGTQRVQNWKKRGIPALVKVQHPNLFMRPQRAKQPAAVPTDTAPQAAEQEG